MQPESLCAVLKNRYFRLCHCQTTIQENDINCFDRHLIRYEGNYPNPRIMIFIEILQGVK